MRALQTIQPTLEEIQTSVSKAGMMMVDVTRRISQWDQRRILSAVEPAGGRTQIVGGGGGGAGGRQSTLPGVQGSTMIQGGGDDDDGRRVSAISDIAVSGAAAKPADGPSLTVPGDLGR